MTTVRGEESSSLPGESVPSRVSIPALAVGNSAQQKLGRILLATAMISAAFLMLPGLLGGPLILDEHGTYWIAGRDNPLTLWERSLNYENIPPLSPALHRLFLDLFGESEMVFRIPSAVWFLLTVLAAYGVGRELFGPAIGGMTAVFTAWHPNVLGEIRLARCYSLSLLLATLFFWISVRWISVPGRMRYALAWVVLGAALIWTHYLNIAVLFVVIPILASEFMGESVRVRIQFVICLLAVGGLGIPLLPSLLRMSVWGENFGFQTETSLPETISAIWWFGLPVGVLAAWICRKCFGTGNAATVIRVPRQTLRWLFAWGLLPSLLVALICRDGLSSLANPRYRIGFEVLNGMFLVALIARRRSAVVACLSVAMALGAAWSVSDRLPWQSKRLSSVRAVQWKQLADHLQTHGEEGEAVFVQSGLGEGFLVVDLYEDPVFMDYASCRIGRFYLETEHPRYALPFVWHPGLPVYEYFRNVLMTIRESGQPTLWVAAATDTDLNQKSLSMLTGLLGRCRFEVCDTVTLTDCVLLRYSPIRSGASADL